MDKIFNPLIKGTFLLSLIIIFLKTLLLDDIDEIWEKGSEVGKIIYDFCLAYSGGYIFYWVTTYESVRMEKQRMLFLHRMELRNLIYRIEDIIVLVLHISGKSAIITHTNQIDANLFNSVDDRIIVDSDAIIDNMIGKMTVSKDGFVEFSGQRHYYEELILQCENMESTLKSIWQSIHHLPMRIIELLDAVRSNKIKTSIAQEINIRTFLRNNNLLASEISESTNSHVFLQTIELIKLYNHIKRLIKSKYNVELENREIVVIKGELGLSHDSIDKKSQST